MPTARVFSPEQKEERRQRHRVYIAGLVVVSMLTETVALLLFAYAGNIGMWVPRLFLLVGVGTSVLVYGFFKLGFNRRLPDKNLLVPQLIVNGAIQVAFLLMAPKLAIVFLAVLIVLSAYAALEFTPQQFTAGWLLYGGITAIALWAVRDDFGYPGTSGIDIALVWLFFFFTLRSLTLPSARFARLRNKLSEKNRLLEESLRQIEELASRDHLTGVYNRRHFMQSIETELLRSDRSGDGFAFAMIDLDFFKMINDRYGHATGDEVLTTFCAIAAQTLRSVDVVGRLGGEEFGVLLPGASAEEGRVSIERLRAAVKAHEWNSVAPGLHVSFSAGVAGSVPGDTVGNVTRRADEALYRVKHRGRDGVAVDGMDLHALCAAD
ncbi:GGDEF domain-containing protein [Noviherbaspirillum sp.]|uniref:GGDEF domain-containing protein n=1 Tax=Noviherbaspirillum sp. TaxID=1926288 RepID=UPI002D2830B0|nr:GGDEF domain-containing protein [Noviherbaspirillum sp.]HZW20669.1 GGDEF domain-containing protein [Noviherbaspirillum sp.]